MVGVTGGPGRALVAVYGLLALAATARSAVQILRDFGAAPLAYSLSAVAAVVYLVATVALARGTAVGSGPTWRAIAWVTVGTELAGVILVGVVSTSRPDLFADATVWSDFGRGYGFVPLVLPILGLWWLRRTARPSADADR